MILLPLASLLSLGMLTAQSSVAEGFEAYSLAAGTTTDTFVSDLDENSIVNGQGPGLVLDGCTYSTLTHVQWTGAGYFNLPTQCIYSHSGGGSGIGKTLILTYDQPVNHLRFDLYALLGHPDDATVTVFDPGGAPIFVSAPIPVAGPVAVPFAYAAPAIGSVTIASTVNNWSLVLDDHVFGTGPQLSVTGACPGAATVAVGGATPGGSVVLALSSSLGSFAIPGGRPCAGTVLGLGGVPQRVATLTADGAGVASANVNLPAGACGRHLQAVDVASCQTTAVVQL